MVPQRSSSQNTRVLSTKEAYDKWAEIYDHDGNVLQQLDDIVVAQKIPQLLQTAKVKSYRTGRTPIRILDLGCGTGRNIPKLIHQPIPVHVIACDGSKAMLAVAKRKLKQLDEKEKDEEEKPNNNGVDTQHSRCNGENTIEWIEHDILDKGSKSLLAKFTHQPQEKVDIIICTLVLEHVQLEPFFNVVRQVLKQDGLLLLTNMHAEMGAISAASFRDPETGEKYRTDSYNHNVNDVVDVAKMVGLECLGEIEETGVVDQAHADKLGKRAQKWIGIKMHLCAVFCLTNAPTSQE